VRFAFQVRPRRASWAGSHTSVLLGPPDRRLIVTFQADVLRVCGLSSDGASEWDRSGGGAQIPVARSPGFAKFCTVGPNIVGFSGKSLSHVLR
jgi:hypothetical protein